ncbi:MAG: hypothetical protein M1840_001382 [Geoglossum simile]|nr:MAG: hypothetical protein M1840_001382 [Geoglossum simile]
MSRQMHRYHRYKAFQLTHPSEKYIRTSLASPAPIHYKKAPFLTIWIAGLGLRADKEYPHFSPSQLNSAYRYFRAFFQGRAPERNIFTSTQRAFSSPLTSIQVGIRNILRTCRAVHAEFSEYLYQHTKFIIVDNIGQDELWLRRYIHVVRHPEIRVTSYQALPASPVDISHGSREPADVCWPPRWQGPVELLDGEFDVH